MARYTVTGWSLPSSESTEDGARRLEEWLNALPAESQVVSVVPAKGENEWWVISYTGDNVDPG